MTVEIRPARPGEAGLVLNFVRELAAYEKLADEGEADEGATKIGNHTFRATGVTAYLKNGGTLENAALMANHASTRTTQLYDRRAEEVTLDKVERVST
jgi:integrase